MSDDVNGAPVQGINLLASSGETKVPIGNGTTELPEFCSVSVGYRYVVGRYPTGNTDTTGDVTAASRAHFTISLLFVVMARNLQSGKK